MNNNNGLISIIVPMYNASSFLDRCIGSLINQSYKNIEIILINDGSTDDSLRICQSYEYDKRIKIINKINEGVGVARNIGLDNAKGDYIIFVDADDFIDCTMCEKMINKARAENLDLVFCGYYEIFPSGQTRYVNESKAFYEFVNNKNINLLFNYNKGNRIGSYIWRVLYKKDILHGLKFDKHLYIGEDDIFLVQALLSAKRISYLNEPLYNYLQVGASKGFYKYKARSDYFKVKADYSVKLENILIKAGYNLLATAIRGMAYMDMVSSVSAQKNAYKLVKNIIAQNIFYKEAHKLKYMKALLKCQINLKIVKKVQIRLCFKWVWLYIMTYKLLR